MRRTARLDPPAGALLEAPQPLPGARLRSGTAARARLSSAPATPTDQQPQVNGFGLGERLALGERYTAFVGAAFVGLHHYHVSEGVRLGGAGPAESAVGKGRRSR